MWKKKEQFTKRRSFALRTALDQELEAKAQEMSLDCSTLIWLSVKIALMRSFDWKVPTAPKELVR